MIGGYYQRAAEAMKSRDHEKWLIKQMGDDKNNRSCAPTKGTKVSQLRRPNVVTVVQLLYGGKNLIKRKMATWGGGGGRKKEV